MAGSRRARRRRKLSVAPGGGGHDECGHSTPEKVGGGRDNGRRGRALNWFIVAGAGVSGALRLRGERGVRHWVSIRRQVRADVNGLRAVAERWP